VTYKFLRLVFHLQIPEGLEEEAARPYQEAAEGGKVLHPCHQRLIYAQQNWV
jgi:hypothetical protein